MDTFDFLDLSFGRITLDEKNKIADFLQKYPHCLNGYTFPSLLAWGEVYSYGFAFIDEETLIISTYLESTKEQHLLEPVGLFPLNIQHQFLQSISKNPYPVKIFAVSDSFIEKNKEFCSHFNDQNERKFANYIYKTSDLALLPGNHYEKKRNLLSQAEKLYQWEVEALTDDCHAHCVQILLSIGKKATIEPDLLNELKALKMMLTHFKELKIKGLVIKVENKPVAFSIYGELNKNMVDIYFEKADRNFKGLYQLINLETAKACLYQGYEFINREEDLGIEGLRQAKMSYFPSEIISFHLLTTL